MEPIEAGRMGRDLVDALDRQTSAMIAGSDRMEKSAAKIESAVDKLESTVASTQQIAYNVVDHACMVGGGTIALLIILVHFCRWLTAPRTVKVTSVKE